MWEALRLRAVMQRLARHNSRLRDLRASPAATVGAAASQSLAPAAPRKTTRSGSGRLRAATRQSSTAIPSTSQKHRCSGLGSAQKRRSQRHNGQRAAANSVRNVHGAAAPCVLAVAGHAAARSACDRQSSTRQQGPGLLPRQRARLHLQRSKGLRVRARPPEDLRSHHVASCSGYRKKQDFQARPRRRSPLPPLRPQWRRLACMANGTRTGSRIVPALRAVPGARGISGYVACYSTQLYHTRECSARGKSARHLPRLYT